MFAELLEVDVPQHDHLVVALDLVEGALEQRHGIDCVAGEESS